MVLASMPGRPHSPASEAFMRAVKVHDWPA